MSHGEPFDVEKSPGIGEVIWKLVGQEMVPHQVVLFNGDLILVNVFAKNFGDLFSFDGVTLYRVCPLGETARPIVLGGVEAHALAGTSATLFHNCEWLPKFIGTNGLLTDEQPIVKEPKASKATKVKKAKKSRAKVRN
jgi:hypothetical protein